MRRARVSVSWPYRKCGRPIATVLGLVEGGQLVGKLIAQRAEYQMGVL
jgi:hypothetical protein